MKKMLSVLPTAALVLVLGACGSSTDDTEPSTSEDVEQNNETAVSDKDIETKPFTVLVDLKDSEGTTKGTVELEETDEGVNVSINADGLPEGKHGFHFHEHAVCEAPDFESAGGHFNPEEMDHGLEMENGPHAGDLPNLEVSKDGTVNDQFIAKQVTLEQGKPNSLLDDSGTSLVIHADKDDGKTQPSGDSGDRIVCGVIQ